FALRQCWDRVLLLARHVEPLATRRQRSGLERCHDGCGIRQELLQVVQHEQQVLLAQELVEAVTCTDDLRNRRLDAGGIGEGRDGAEAAAGGELVRELGRSLNGKTRLPRPAGAGHRDERARAQKVANLGQLALPPDERARLYRKVRPVEALERRKLG